jgi:Not1 N-terminal domain, CCR4-Not complex component
MERFREHEKEFKKKQFSKKALLNMRDNNMFSSNNDSDSEGNHDHDFSDDSGELDYYQEDDDLEDGEGQPEEISEEQKAEQRSRDREYLIEVQDFLKQQVLRVELELEQLRNKKSKAPPKKQKERQVMLSARLTTLRKLRDRNEEIMSSLEFIDAKEIKNAKVVLGQYMLLPDSPEIGEQQVLLNTQKSQQLESELTRLAEMAENTKKTIQLSSQQQQKDKLKALEIRSKVDLDRHTDVIKDYCRVE